MTDRIEITVDRDGWTKGLQLNIVQVDDNATGWGYRLAGPKYNGSSKNLLRHQLDERDAKEIRAKLDAVFPQEKPDNDAPFSAIAAAIRDFPFANYGLDDVDPNSEYAEWVGDLASQIAGALGVEQPAE